MYHLNCEHWHPFVSQISDKLFTKSIQKKVFRTVKNFSYRKI